MNKNLELSMPKMIDNINYRVRDDLEKTIVKKSKLRIAAACFSIYAYEELKKNLSGIEDLKFIFTSPTFTTDKAEKSKREFYIPRMTREHNLYGTEFEIRLRNELTQRAIAKECADWIKQKATFKSNTTSQVVPGFFNVISTEGQYTYMPFNEFTTVDLGCERGNYAYNFTQRLSYPMSKSYIDLFEQLWNDRKNFQDVTDQVIESITAVYNENSPEFIYSVTIARSRKHIEKYYDTAEIGRFPERLVPKSHRPHLTDLKNAIGYNEIFEQLTRLNLDIYRPSHYILPSRMDKYAELYGDNKVNIGFTQANREQGIRRLMAINLMKRMESSVYSFNLTLRRIKELIESTIKNIDNYENTVAAKISLIEKAACRAWLVIR